MGKGLLLLVTATLIGGTIAWNQLNRTNIETTARQSERQEEILAREIARSGLNMTVARMRQDERLYPDSTTSMQARVDRVNGNDGVIVAEYKRGHYEARVERVSVNAFAVRSDGHYGDAMATVQVGHDSPASGLVPKEVLEVRHPSTVDVRFIKSIAGYCSAIFLQRFVPMENGSGRYEALEPDLLFASGHNRNGHGMDFHELVLQPGDRLNFILAVDQGCRLKGRTDITSKHPHFNYLRNGLEEGVEELAEMKEGKYALIERSEADPHQYRIAFEDLEGFTDAQIADIKKNGYGNQQWRNTGNKRRPNWTYGGTGWNIDYSTAPHNYRDLRDFGQQPDFSDQVITVTLKPYTPAT